MVPWISDQYLSWDSTPPSPTGGGFTRVPPPQRGDGASHTTRCVGVENTRDYDHGGGEPPPLHARRAWGPLTA
ncbi:hypothetical protein G9A89_000516, partial [Geosiphon pyriformis]